MTSLALKKKITGKINNADDLLLDLIDALIEKYEQSIKEESGLNTRQQKEVERRMILHDSGKLKYYTLSEIKKSLPGTKKNK